MNAPTWPRPFRVAVVGGGLTGSVVAFALGRSAAADSLAVDVIEPRGQLGAGLAYSTEEPSHRINVPASKMTIRTDVPNHFVDWLSRPDGPILSPGTATLRGDLFPQRRIFADYVSDQLAPLIASGRVRHRRLEAAAAYRSGEAYVLILSNGERLEADAVVLAATHPRPRPPEALSPVLGCAAVVADPYAPGALDGIGGADRVLIVGCGLTSADAIATLDARGHPGPIVALSRRGWRSRGHGPKQGATSADFAKSPAATARDLLESIRAAVAADAEAGLTWHPTVDRVREQGREIWAALPDAERRRLLRHLRQAWEAHRFRLPPQVEETLERRLRAGRLAYVSGRLQGATVAPDGLAVSWRPRGSGGTSSERFDRIVVATGPAHADLMTGDGVVARLVQSGDLVPDNYGLGLTVDGRSRAVDRSGRASGALFVAGPLARGTFGELMGVPEVVAHGEMIADEIAAIAASPRLARHAS